MDSRKLSALLSSLVSQLTLLLFLFPSSSSTLHSLSSDSNSHENLFPLLQHFLCSQEIVTSLVLLSISRKRKRAHCPDPESETTHEDRESPPVEVVMTRSPGSFKTCFNMTSTTFEWLSGLLEPLLECRDPVGSPLNLSAELRLGIGLYRLANGSNYSDIAARFGVTESVTRFCAKQLCRVLCTNFRFWVAFPSQEELKSVSNSFEELTGLPNCCGVIDCARFKIVKDDEMRKEDSIAVQIVVDSSSRILSIVAGFRGDKPDSTVLKLSTLHKDIEEGRLLNSSPVYVNGVAVNQYLVGDGGYHLLPWLMVPYEDFLPGSCEEKFNAAHRFLRVPASKAIASLKNWGVLSKPIREELKSAVAFIGACSILHNVLLMREDDSAFCERSGDDHDSQLHWEFRNLGDDSKKGFEIRRALAARAAEFQDGNDPISPRPMQTD